MVDRRLSAFAREPLLHFLVLGVALFALEAWLRPATDLASDSQIVISKARINHLTAHFVRLSQRPPTREELDSLVEAYVREEVMVREALALGLDRDDPAIRKRLQQKLEFIAEGLLAPAAPTDAQLNAFLEAHPDRFSTPARVSFSQIYLDPMLRKAALAVDAARLLQILNAPGSTHDLATAGDRLLLLEPRYGDVPQDELAQQFGSAFAQALSDLAPGRWAGPMTSGYGAHLVRVDKFEPGGIPPLASVRPLVEREWANVRREELARVAYTTLRAKYKVTVQMSDGGLR